MLSVQGSKQTRGGEESAPLPAVSLLLARMREGIFVASRLVQVELELEDLEMFGFGGCAYLDKVIVNEFVCNVREAEAEVVNSIQVTQVQ